MRQHTSDPLQTPVGIIPAKEFRSLGKGGGLMTTVPLGEVLTTHFESPALFCTYFVTGEDRWPRLRKRGTDLIWIRDRGADVRLRALVFDYDRPKTNGQKSPWESPDGPSELLTRLYDAGLEPTAFYSTKHGARLIYVLDRDLSLDEWEVAFTAQKTKLAAIGVHSDENAEDWTRFFVAPYVTKEDEKLWERPEIFVEVPGTVLEADSVLRGAPRVVAAAAAAAADDGRPDPATCIELRQEHKDRLRLLSDAVGLDDRHPLCQLLPDHPLPQASAGRDQTLYSLAGDLCEVLVNQRWASPDLGYALLEPTAASFDPDDDDPGKDWCDELWEKVVRRWDEKTSAASDLDRLRAVAVDYALEHRSGEHPSNDSSNVDVLERLYGNQVLFVKDSGGIFAYNDARGVWEDEGRHFSVLKRKALVLPHVWRAWARMEEARAERLLRDGADEQYHEDAVTEAKRCLTMANASSNLRGVNAAFGLLPGRARLCEPREEDAFDRDADLLCAANGIVRLPTKANPTAELLPHAPEHRCSKQANVEYDPRAGCPRWTAFVEWVFPNPTDRDYFQRRCGTYLTGRQELQRIDVLNGEGRNGKSTVYGVFVRILGDYVVVVPSTFFAPRDNKYLPTDYDTVRTRGARLVIASETDGGCLNTSRVKTLVGEDKLTGQAKFKQPIQFTASFEIALTTNDPPRVEDDSFAIWRRMRVLPCTASITDAEEDPFLKDKLCEEASGILNWMIEGLVKYRTSGLQDSPNIVEATKVYRVTSDPVRAFLDEHLIADPEGLVPTDVLLARFNQGREDAKSRETQKSFRKRLDAIFGKPAIHKVKSGEHRDRVCLHGHRLAAAEEDNSSTSFITPFTPGPRWRNN